MEKVNFFKRTVFNLIVMVVAGILYTGCDKDEKAIFVSGVTLTPASLELYIGETAGLTCAISPVDAWNQSLTWSSSNTDVATIDSLTKTVTAVGSGTAEITVRTSDGGKTASCNVTVWQGKNEGRWAWRLDEGTLRISGEGATANYTASSTPPWDAHKSKITKAVIEEGISGLGDYSFYKHANLKEIVFPKSLTGIGNYAFRECTGLTSIVIGESVTSIGDYAFSQCSNVTSLTLPNSLKTIGKGAFLRCSRISSLSLGNSVETIGPYAFQFLSALTSITIPQSVKTIQEYAFSYCRSVTSLTLGNSVETIGEYAFADLNIVSVNIPASVKSISKYAFDIPALTKYVVDGNNSSYSSQDGVLFNKDKTTLIHYPKAKPEKAYVIPSSVKTIDVQSFQNAMLTEVTVPKSVSKIGSSAFWNARLTSIKVEWTSPSSVTVESDMVNYPSEISLHVPDGTSAAYLASKAWKDFKIVDNGMATLRSLKLSDASGDISLSPSFSPTTKSYTIYLYDNATVAVKIAAEASTPDATITGAGTVNVTPTMTSLTVTVTAKNGNKETYTIRIEREPAGYIYYSTGSYTNPEKVLYKTSGNMQYYITVYTRYECDYIFRSYNYSGNVTITFTIDGKSRSVTLSNVRKGASYRLALNISIDVKNMYKVSDYGITYNISYTYTDKTVTARVGTQQLLSEKRSTRGVITAINSITATEKTSLPSAEKLSGEISDNGAVNFIIERQP
ncbi:MAG: leucine-rich repeat protein [Tannerella sp.]|jgi:hypothetical protein|nr:leucine-rich repeat protein [Tannerella sp.]